MNKASGLPGAFLLYCHSSGSLPPNVMAGTVDCKKTLAVLSVKVSKSLEREVRVAAHQDCRTLTEEAMYLLEVMAAVVSRCPRFPLKRDYNEGTSVMKGQLKFDIQVELYDKLFHSAGEYGLRITELARLYWIVALDFRKLLGLKSQMLTKEDFISSIVKRFQKKQIH